MKISDVKGCFGGFVVFFLLIPFGVLTALKNFGKAGFYVIGVDTAWVILWCGLILGYGVLHEKKPPLCLLGFFLWFLSWPVMLGFIFWNMNLRK